MQFRNPSNGYVETGTTWISGLWVFLFAPLYYAAKGIWTHALVSLVLGLIGMVWTFGILTFLTALVYAFLNGGLVRAHYLRRGWVEA